MRKLPTQYREKNNKSFEKNIEFGIGEVLKLLTNGVIEEVDEEKVICTNPLSVASNRIGKRRLCIDLSHHVNVRRRNLRLKVSQIL